MKSNHPGLFSAFHAGLLAVMLTLLATSAYSGPPPVQTYFIPANEAQIRATFLGVSSDAGADVWNVISISPGSSNTWIYYDQRENGYEPDIANPASIYSSTNTRGTQIWGDNNPSNGIPPGFSTDRIGPGKVIVLTNSVPVPTDPARVYYGGGDKIGATRAIAVTYLSWPLDPGPVLADGIEVYDSRMFGTNFVAPVGVNSCTSQPYPMFSYSALAIMASMNGTVIQVDTNADGVTDLNATLNQGDSFLANSNGTIRAGAEIKASKPVQVHLFTGRRNSSYQSRWFTLDARERWSSNYYTSVGTTAGANPVGVVLFNPYTNGLTVNYRTRSTTNGNVTVSARNTFLLPMPTNSGAMFASSRAFAAVSVVDLPTSVAGNDGDDFDWGSTLLPDDSLTPSILVGYGAGSSDLSLNGNPVWIMALKPATLFVDFDANPLTGPLLDGNKNHYDVSYTVTNYESKRIFNTSGSNNQTGMRVYTTNGVKIVAAWGEDPATATKYNPYVDAGTTIFGLPDISGSKSAALTNDVNGNGLCEPRDGILYVLRINNEGGGELKNVIVTDPLPSNTVYIAGSTLLDGTPVPDDGVTNLTAYPLDEGGKALPTIPAFSSLTLSFMVQVGTAFPVTCSNVVNTATAVSPAGQVVMQASLPVFQADLALGKGASQPFVRPGSNFTFTVALTNRGPNAVTAVSVGDLLPAGLAYVSGGNGAYNVTNGRWTVGSMAVGAATSLTVTVKAPAAGVFTNKAEVWSSSLFDPNSTPSNGILTENDFGSAIVTSGIPAITLVKTADSVPDGAVRYVTNGASVVYRYRVVNAGKSHLVNILVSDDKLGSAGSLPGPLAPGATADFYATSPALFRGVTNIGTVSGTPSLGNGVPLAGFSTVTATDDAVVATATPRVDLVKTAGSAPDGAVLFVPPGTNVVYTYRVSNPGDTWLVNLSVTDNVLGVVGSVPGPLAPGASAFLYATHVNTTGSVVNVGVATATPADSGGVPLPGFAAVSDTDTASVVVSRPGIQLVKTAGGAASMETLFVRAGTNVAYAYEITINGDTALTNVTVTDDKLGLVGVLPGPLATGTVHRLYKTHASVVASVTNTAVAVGWPVNGLAPVTDTHQAFVKVVSPGVSLVKTADDAADGLTNWVRSGSAVTYSYRITNTGDTHLVNLAVTDDRLGAVGTVPGPLPPGGTRILTKTAPSITQHVVNIGTVTGAPADPDGHPLARVAPVRASDDAVVRIASPAVSIVQTAGDAPDGCVYYTRSGSCVPHAYAIVNTGDTWLANVTVQDDRLGWVGNVPGLLAPGESRRFGSTNPCATSSVTNWGTVTGAAALPGGTLLPKLAPVTDTDDAIVKVFLPGIDIVKTAGSAADGETLYIHPGDDVTYTYQVMNTGDTALANVAVSDDVLGDIGAVEGLLAPGDSAVFTALQEAVAADVVNVASVQGTPVFDGGTSIPGIPPVSATDDADTRVAYFTVHKEDTPDPVHPGDSLTYVVWVANPSPNPVKDLLVTDTYPAGFNYAHATPAPVSGNNVWMLDELEPGGLFPIVIGGTVSAGAPANAVLTNRVRVTSSNAGTVATEEPTLIAATPKGGKTEIRLTKRDDVDPVAPGAPLTYTIRVENFGPVTATNVMVTETYDPLFTFESAEPAPRTGTSNSWALGKMAANTFAEIVIHGRVAASATNGYVLLDVALAKARNAAPSSDAELTLVGVVPPPAIEKTCSLDPVLGNHSLIYTVTVANVSQTLIRQVSVIESYDPDFLFSHADPAPVAGTLNTWFIGDMPAGSSVSIVISGIASKRSQDEDLLFNTAEVVSRSGSRTVHLTTRVINPPPNPVRMLFFRAVDVENGVKLKWETATELDCLGFNVYRAESVTGKRLKVNGRLIPASNTMTGNRYHVLDGAAKPGVTYYYWLEELAYNYKSREWGPAVRPGSKQAVASGAGKTALFRVGEKSGLYRIRFRDMITAGLPAGSIDPASLGVSVAGRRVPVFVNTAGLEWAPEDSLLFYLPPSDGGRTCRLTLDGKQARMELADARPLTDPGDVLVDRASRSQRIAFETIPNCIRCFLFDFSGPPVWVMDVTEPTNAVMLVGTRHVVLENGMTAVYLSYEREGGASCLAVQDDAVMDAPWLVKPE